ncbi:hypothetical protein PoB_005150100 [Plakobranchus ocellatus]|uniref:Uncharacterized protein n=1 Tax=Plakobranchus ocellatus TaxID=259542 RepID=A0AAV4BWW1_9GAST|nr:hypothetical protein PoB_005150100 [Plakobranchus ocellatus]
MKQRNFLSPTFPAMKGAVVILESNVILSHLELKKKKRLTALRNRRVNLTPDQIGVPGPVCFQSNKVTVATSKPWNNLVPQRKSSPQDRDFQGMRADDDDNYSAIQYVPSEALREGKPDKGIHQYGSSVTWKLFGGA